MSLKQLKKDNIACKVCGSVFPYNKGLKEYFMNTRVITTPYRKNGKGTICTNKNEILLTKAIVAYVTGDLTREELNLIEKVILYDQHRDKSSVKIRR
jgi:hypothetical protein